MEKQQWHVRPAILRDLDTLVGFQRQMALETEGWELDPATLERGMLQTFLDANKGKYWVAEIPNATKKDKPVGMLMTQYEWSDWRCQNVIWIQSVFITEEARRKGVYRAMYEYLWQQVQEDDSLSGIRLYVERQNENAIKTYKALGMETEHYALCEQMKDF
ncbi:MAG: GNAT family N-acetyltransferase [Bacteroidota bacterium]